MYDVHKIRADFPILSRQVNGKDLVYLDNGASAQKPQVVIDAINQAYSHEYANVHRGLHYLSNLATDKFEAVRGTVKRFLNAADEAEILFTSGTTEAINLVSYAWAAEHLGQGDEIILSVMEHHANIVPWHFLRERSGVKLVWVEPQANGDLDPQTVLDAITPRTKMIALTQMSNVLGTVVDVKTICHAARAQGIVTLVDGSQSSVHMKVDVQDIGCDFFAITGHKLYGPSGSGALYARAERLAQMRPFMGGGDMIRDVTREAISYNDAPHKFEAGTPGIVQMIGLGAALDYLSEIGMDAIRTHEQQLTAYMNEQITGLNWLNIHGQSAQKGAIFSFTLDGAGHPHDISTILDQRGIAVRAGHHCAQPLMAFLGETATTRASFGLYNTQEEVDQLLDALHLCAELFA